MSGIKQSIKKQYAVVFCLLLGGMIFVLCLANALSLGRFYMYHKEKVLYSAYNDICKGVEKGNINSDSFNVTFRKISSMNNMDILILDSDMHVVKSSIPDPAVLTSRLVDYIFRGTDDVSIIYSDENVQIQRASDHRVNLEYIELWGMLGNDYMIVMRSPVESIEESALLANELMVIVGIVGALVGFIVVMVITRRITHPVMELVRISERMTHLDFRARYMGDSCNEIGLLGEHINKLSHALETTISDLKSANAKLQQDIDIKTQEEERRKEFIANISHELKTPIALIQGYAEGLKDNVNDDPESRDFYCDVIMDEASKMNTLVRNLLELDQIESGLEESIVEHFDLTEVIYNCVQSMEIMLKQEEITVQLPDKDPIYVWADEFKIEQIVNNYLSNAIHYAKGDKTVRITCEKHDELVRVSMFNTGEHIPEESLSQIWTKFYKVDKARTRTYGGSGIGLSIVKAIMDSMGRDYGVENVEDGVVFWFEIDATSRLPGSTD